MSVHALAMKIIAVFSPKWSTVHNHQQTLLGYLQLNCSHDFI